MSGCGRGLLVLLALAACFPGVALADEAEDLAKIGAAWTLPEGWEFQPLTDEQREDKYHAVAVSHEIPAQMYMMSDELGDRTLKEIARDALGVIRYGLFKTVTAVKSTTGTLSGLEGFRTYGQGTVEGGHEVYAMACGAELGGRFYVVLSIAYYGRHREAWRELDAAQRGFQILKGGQDEPATGPPPELVASRGAGGAGEINWPENGPQREDRTIIWPTQNLRLHIPEETLFDVVHVHDDEAEQPQVPAISFMAKLGNATATVDISIEPRVANVLPSQIVQDTLFETRMARQLTERRPGRDAIDKDLQVGGMEAAFLLLRGKNHEGKYAAIGTWVAAHSELLYVVQVRLHGDLDADKVVLPAVEQLIAGLELIDATKPILGPLAGPVLPSFADRGKGLGEVSTVEPPWARFQKPALLAELDLSKLDPKPGIHVAVEGRSEDNKAYFYMDVSWFRFPKKKQEDPTKALIAERVKQWQADAGRRAVVGDEEEPWIKVRWAKAKGLGWSFEGELDGQPFTELGYVVKHKDNGFVIRLQFGGDDAEAALHEVVKQIEDGWTWVKK